MEVAARNRHAPVLDPTNERREEAWLWLGLRQTGTQRKLPDHSNSLTYRKCISPRLYKWITAYGGVGDHFLSSYGCGRSLVGVKTDLVSSPATVWPFVDQAVVPILNIVFFQTIP